MKKTFRRWVPEKTDINEMLKDATLNPIDTVKTPRSMSVITWGSPFEREHVGQPTKEVEITVEIKEVKK